MLDKLFTKKKRVIYDTNAILLTGKGIDVFSEVQRIMQFPHTLAVLSGTLEELEKIRQDPAQKGDDKFCAKLGIVLIKQKGLKIIKSSSNELVDDVLVSLANDDTYIVTQDKALQERIRDKKGHIIALKQKKYLYQRF